MLKCLSNEQCYSCQISPKWSLKYLIVHDESMPLGKICAWLSNINRIRWRKRYLVWRECRLRLKRPQEILALMCLWNYMSPESGQGPAVANEDAFKTKTKTKRSRKIQLKKVILKVSSKLTFLGWIVSSKKLCVLWMWHYLGKGSS